MSIKKRKRGKRLRGVGLQRRLTRSKQLRFIVRWIEYLEDGPEPFSKSFSDLEEAQKFKKICELKLGIAQIAKSTMAHQMRPSGDLRLVIAEYVASARQRTKKRSRYHKMVDYYLSPLPDLMGWNKTADIPVDAFSLIAQKLAGRGTYTVRVTQRTLRSFVKWCWRTYAFEEGVTEGAVPRRSSKRSTARKKSAAAQRPLLVRQATGALPHHLASNALGSPPTGGFLVDRRELAPKDQ